MSERRVVRVSELDVDQLTALTAGPHWKVVGNGVWERLEHPQRGSIEHAVVLVGEEVVYDVAECNFRRGPVILPYRINPDGIAEFYVIEENRPLVRDDEGQWGRMHLISPPAGLAVDETDYENAALDELLEETGYRPRNLQHMGFITLSPATSGMRLPAFLAEIDYYQMPEPLQLGRHEAIRAGAWYGNSELQRKILEEINRDSRLIAVHYLAQAFLPAEVLR